MPKIVRSIKGEMIDFDLLKIKQEMTKAPSPLEVTERRNYIDNKLQRRIRRAKEELQKTGNKPKNGLVDIAKTEEVENKSKPSETVRTIKKGTVND